jgi:hypothetical protein
MSAEQLRKRVIMDQSNMLENVKRLQKLSGSIDSETAQAARYALSVIKAAMLIASHLERLASTSFVPRKALESALRGESVGL